MLKLLSAEFFRIKKERSILIGLLIIVILAFVTPLLFLMIKSLSEAGEFGVINGEMIYLSSFSPLNNAGIAIPIIVALILLKEFSNGTIRNKIITGHSRANIFFAGWISISVLSTILFVLNALFSLIFAVMFLGYGSAITVNEVLNLLVATGLAIIISIFLSTIIVVAAYIVKSIGYVILIYFGALILLMIVGQVMQSTNDSLFETIGRLVPTVQLTYLQTGEALKIKDILFPLISVPIYTVLLLLFATYNFKQTDLK